MFLLQSDMDNYGRKWTQKKPPLSDFDLHLMVRRPDSNHNLNN